MLRNNETHILRMRENIPIHLYEQVLKVKWNVKERKQKVIEIVYPFDMQCKQVTTLTNHAWEVQKQYVEIFVVKDGPTGDAKGDWRPEHQSMLMVS